MLGNGVGCEVVGDHAAARDPAVSEAVRAEEIGDRGLTAFHPTDCETTQPRAATHAVSELVFRRIPRRRRIFARSASVIPPQIPKGCRVCSAHTPQG